MHHPQSTARFAAEEVAALIGVLAFSAAVVILSYAFDGSSFPRQSSPLTGAWPASSQPSAPARASFHFDALASLIEETRK